MLIVTVATAHSLRPLSPIGAAVSGDGAAGASARADGPDLVRLPGTDRREAEFVEFAQDTPVHDAGSV